MSNQITECVDEEIDDEEESRLLFEKFEREEQVTRELIEQQEAEQEKKSSDADDDYDESEHYPINSGYIAAGYHEPDYDWLNDPNYPRELLTDEQLHQKRAHFTRKREEECRNRPEWRFDTNLVRPGVTPAKSQPLPRVVLKPRDVSTDELPTVYTGNSTEIDEPDPIINDFLSPGQCMSFVGETGVGKSVLSVQCGLSLCATNEFLGLKYARTGPAAVLYVGSTAEDSETLIAARRDAIMKEMDFPDNMLKRSAFHFTCLESEEDEFIGELRQILELYESTIPIVIIDPLTHFIHSDNTPKAFLRHKLSPLLREFDAAAILILHTGVTTMGRGAYSASGGAGFANVSRMTWEIKGAACEDFHDFICTKKHDHIDWTDSEGNPTNTLHMRHSPDTVFWLPVEHKAIQSIDCADEFLELLLPGKTIKQKDLLNAAKGKCGEKLARTYCRELADNGKIIKSTKARRGTRPEVFYSRKQEARTA